MDEWGLGTVRQSCKRAEYVQAPDNPGGTEARPNPRSSMTSHPPRARHGPLIADGLLCMDGGCPWDESAGAACSDGFTSSQAHKLTSLCVCVCVCTRVVCPTAMIARFQGGQ